VEAVTRKNVIPHSSNQGKMCLGPMQPILVKT